MSNVAQLRSGGSLAAIVPQTIEDAYRLSTMAFKSGMLKPLKSGYGDNAVEESPEATLARGTMIIMQGMEIGVPPMQSIQLLAMINGRITAHSEAVPGILLSKGFKLKESWSGTPMADDWTCTVELTRPDGERFTSSFSVADAKQAKLWDQRAKIQKKGRGGSTYEADNDSAWYRYPKRMLKARALGFVGKDGGADALRGIMVREEADDMERVEDMRDVTPVKVAKIVTTSLDLPDIPDEATPEADDSPIADVASYLAKLREERGYCQSMDDLTELREANADLVARLPASAKSKAEAILSDDGE